MQLCPPPPCCLSPTPRATSAQQSHVDSPPSLEVASKPFVNHGNPFFYMKMFPKLPPIAIVSHCKIHRWTRMTKSSTSVWVTRYLFSPRTMILGSVCVCGPLGTRPTSGQPGW